MFGPSNPPFTFGERDPTKGLSRHLQVSISFISFTVFKSTHLPHTWCNRLLTEEEYSLPIHISLSHPSQSSGPSSSERVVLGSAWCWPSQGRHPAPSVALFLVARYTGPGAQCSHFTGMTASSYPRTLNKIARKAEALGGFDKAAPGHGRNSEICGASSLARDSCSLRLKEPEHQKAQQPNATHAIPQTKSPYFIIPVL